MDLHRGHPRCRPLDGPPDPEKAPAGNHPLQPAGVLQKIRHPLRKAAGDDVPADPRDPGDRLCPPLCTVQTCDPALCRCGPSGPYPGKERPARHIRLCRQGPSCRWPGHRPDPGTLPAHAVAPFLRQDLLYRGLQPGDLPPDGAGLRCLAQQSPPPLRGLRHQRPESGGQRRPQSQRGRRLVVRRLQRHQRLDHRPPGGQRQPGPRTERL